MLKEAKYEHNINEKKNEKSYGANFLYDIDHINV